MLATFIPLYKLHRVCGFMSGSTWAAQPVWEVSACTVLALRVKVKVYLKKENLNITAYIFVYHFCTFNNFVNLNDSFLNDCFWFWYLYLIRWLSGWGSVLGRWASPVYAPPFPFKQTRPGRPLQNTLLP